MGDGYERPDWEGTKASWCCRLRHDCYQRAGHEDECRDIYKRILAPLPLPGRVEQRLRSLELPAEKHDVLVQLVRYLLA